MEVVRDLGVQTIFQNFRVCENKNLLCDWHCLSAVTISSRTVLGSFRRPLTKEYVLIGGGYVSKETNIIGVFELCKNAD